MERQVQLSPGVTVPDYAALWAMYGDAGDGTRQGANSKGEDMRTLLASYLPKDALAAKFNGGSIEDTITEGGNGSRSVGDVADGWLRTLQRAERAGRIKKAYRHDGGVRVSEEGRIPKPKLFALGEDDITAKLSEDGSHWGTNKILEQILKLDGESAKTSFLMKLVDGRCDGNYSKCLEGAQIVRAAFQLAKFYGLVETYSGNPQKMAMIFMAILDSVNRGSMPLTDSLIEHYGLRDMPGLMSRHQPFRKFDALVPRKDVYNIASAMKMPGLRQLEGPALMRELGYNAVYHAGTPILFYKPGGK